MSSTLRRILCRLYESVARAVRWARVNDIRISGTTLAGMVDGLVRRVLLIRVTCSTTVPATADPIVAIHEGVPSEGV